MKEKDKRILAFTSLTKLIGTVLTLVAQCEKGEKLHSKDRNIILENLAGTMAIIAEALNIEEKDIETILMEESKSYKELFSNNNQHGEA